MDGFALALGRGGYAQRDGRCRRRKGNRRWTRKGELYFRPGHPKRFGEPRPGVVQDCVCGRFPTAAQSSRRRADGQRSYLPLHLSACSETLVAKFQEERKQAAKRKPHDTA